MNYLYSSRLKWYMIIVGEIETAKEKSLFCHVMCHEERSEMLRPHIHFLSEYSCSPWHLSCQKLNLKLWPPSHHTSWAMQSSYFTSHFKCLWICKSNLGFFLLWCSPINLTTNRKRCSKAFSVDIKNDIWTWMLFKCKQIKV